MNLPIMQRTIHFLNSPLFRCKGAKTITPIMPDIIGLPPTTPTAKGKSSPPNQGSIKKERTTETPLKIPKKHPKAKSISK